MICELCRHEVYKYRTFLNKEKIVNRCFYCSSDNFPGLSITKRLIDVNENLWMSPASYHKATHTVLDNNNQPFIDKTGKYINKTLIPKLKERLK